METVHTGGQGRAAHVAGASAFPRIIRVERDGGLLSHLSVWQNLLLPLEYHARNAAHVAEDAALLFELCGENGAELPRLTASYPDALTAYEVRLAGFIRAMLLEPDVVVLDDVFEGLADSEKEKVMLWEKVFHLRFPFRTLFYHGQAGCEMSERNA